MKRWFLIFIIGMVLVFLSQTIELLPEDPETVAASAYQRGDYEEAVAQYQQAARHADDLGRVAHNQAAAMYRLEQYADADTRYRQAAEHGDELRAARAAYDRGTCALRMAYRAAADNPDPRLLAMAVEHYRACLDREPVVIDAGSLFEDARHNMELAKLLLDHASDEPAAQEPPPDPQAADGAKPNGNPQAATPEASANARSPQLSTDGWNNHAPPKDDLCPS